MPVGDGDGAAWRGALRAGRGKERRKRTVSGGTGSAVANGTAFCNWGSGLYKTSSGVDSSGVNPVHTQWML